MSTDDIQTTIELRSPEDTTDQLNDLSQNTLK